MTPSIEDATRFSPRSSRAFVDGVSVAALDKIRRCALALTMPRGRTPPARGRSLEPGKTALARAISDH